MCHSNDYEEICLVHLDNKILSLESQHVTEELLSLPLPFTTGKVMICYV